jgi:FixJ family two-component response regulator
MENGAAAFFYKPVDRADLLETIEQVRLVSFSQRGAVRV